MREYEYTLQGDRMRRGLRKSYRAGRNTAGLVELQNMIVHEEGLASYEELPFSVPYQYLVQLGLNQLGWPEPMIFQGKRKTLMIYKQGIYLIDEDSWIPYLLDDIRDTDNVNNSYTPKLGNVYDFVDLGNSWLLVNGRSSVLYWEHEQMTGGTDYARGTDNLRIQTGCTFRGRMLLGGFDPDYSIHSTIKTLVQGFADDLVSNFDTSMEFSNQHVVWSNVGISLFWMFYPTIAQNGVISGAGYGATRPWLFELMMRGDMGWMPMPWRGYVLHTRAMKDVVMVYGEGGISFLYPTIDPTPTFGRVDLSMFSGVNNKGAVGGDENTQIFLDSEGELHMVEQGDGGRPKMQKLGYKEWFKDNLDLEWVISYDAHEQLFYICNGNETFLLTRYGLSTCKQLVTSITYRDGTTACLGSELTDNQLIWVLDEADLFRAEITDLEWVKIGANKTQRYKVAIDYKYEDDDEWTRSDWKPVNSQGAVYIGIRARAFRLCIKTVALDGNDEYEITEVDPPDWITFTIKHGDKRFTRGVNIANVGD